MARTLLSNVSIFDGSGADLFPGEVLVDGNRIEAVAKAPERLDRSGAEVVDGGGATLMPGLIESHAHITFLSTVDRRVADPLGPSRPGVEETTLMAARAAGVLLDYGFTSAYSGGSHLPKVEVAIRNEIDGGWLPGPRLKASSFEMQHPGPSGLRERSGTDAMREFVNDMAGVGVNCIKLVISQDRHIEETGGGPVIFSEDEIAATAEAAHEAGLFLTAHVRPAEAIKWTLRNGFRNLYHCNYIDQEGLDMLEERKASTFVGPAISISYVIANDMSLPLEVREARSNTKIVERSCRVYSDMRQRGIKVLPGGDYGFPNNPIGHNAWDFEHFINMYGYTPAEVLRAATMYGGELMGMGDELGRVKEGCLADLLLVDGNPLEDITLFQDKAKLLMIMKDGAYHKAPAGSASLPKR